MRVASANRRNNAASSTVCRSRVGGGIVDGMRWWIFCACLPLGCGDLSGASVTDVASGSSTSEPSDDTGDSADAASEDDAAATSGGESADDDPGDGDDDGDDGSTGENDDGSVADDGDDDDDDDGGSTGADAEPADGTLSVLTYNVAGLPDFISGSDPLVNTPLMSPLLNDFDLVLAQEDFSYHAELSSAAEHPHQSTPGGGGTLGDGLNRFSQTAFSQFERHGWTQCNGLFDSGSDCLTEKGYSVGLHQLAPGVEVDVYNLHMDAGGSQADIAARQAQIQQMLGTIAVRSAGRALIVAGDTNMDEEDEADFVTLLQGAGLLDACRELTCGDEFRIDRIMYRNSDTLELIPTSWVVDLSFADSNGNQLSDHEAVVTDFDWATP